MSTEEPVYRDPEWLKEHAFEVLSFYYPECIDDDRGGYIHQFSDRDGRVYDWDSKHLVGTCRYVFNFSVGALLDGPDWCLDAAAHGVKFLQEAHWDDEYGGYTWLLNGTDVADGTKYCYGHSFVVLALATAYEAGIEEALGALEDAVAVVDTRFWEPEDGLCLTECTRAWEPDSYRGQNANMHMCEAMLAAFEATGAEAYRKRAASIADAIARRFPDRGDGLVWEHYDEDWNHDWAYNIEDKDNFFRPWGYLAGHQVEWTKLLLLLERHHEADWLAERARHLFDRTVGVAWDDAVGGLYYTVDREGEVIMDEKFYWVMAEALSAAALLALRTGEEEYWDWYDRLWSYSEAQLVTDDLGIWYRILDSDNAPRADLDKNPRVKTDYHTVGACCAVIDGLQGA
jgi:mannose/cellobiose epimerase-like protein (N-acyl-D-glucosamine 2-epimerase family)